MKNSTPPILPYIGLYLTDLTFIEDANKNILNDKINFSKCRKLAKVIREIQTDQQKPYEFIGKKYRSFYSKISKELLSYQIN